MREVETGESRIGLVEEKALGRHGLAAPCTRSVIRPSEGLEGSHGRGVAA